MLAPQLIIVILILLVMLGTLISKDLGAYGTQLMALLLLFYFALDYLRKRTRKKDTLRARRDEETLLFLTTYLKPKLTDLTDLTAREENLELIKKQIQLVEREVDRFLEDKENEMDK